MTRVNLVPPKNLHFRHLLAELREIKRIPNVIKKGKYTLENMPKKFQLGKGHVKFFYDKLLFLHKRYQALYQESLLRGYQTTNFEDAFHGVPDALYNDWIPEETDIRISEKRIEEKKKQKPELYL